MLGSWNPGNWFRFSNSTNPLVKATGFLGLQGILCSSSSTWIIEVWDTTGTDVTAGAIQVQDDLTLVAGTSYPMPAKLTQGLYIKTISGSGKATAYYN